MIGKDKGLGVGFGQQPQGKLKGNSNASGCKQLAIGGQRKMRLDKENQRKGNRQKRDQTSQS